MKGCQKILAKPRRRRGLSPVLGCLGACVVPLFELAAIGMLAETTEAEGEGMRTKVGGIRQAFPEVDGYLPGPAHAMV